MSQRAALNMPAARVGGLKVYLESWTERLPPTSERHKIIEAAIHLALLTLESEQGRRSLVGVAEAILEAGRGQPTPRPDIYRRKLGDMRRSINQFLASIRLSFPPVQVSGRVEGEAEAERRRWCNNMDEYDASTAGYVYLSRVLIDNMVYARQNDESGTSYDMFKFQLGISIAHEIVHLLTGFISGPPQPDTPPDITMTPYGDDNAGESGRYWEEQFLGGALEFWSSARDPLRNRQAGTPYLFENGNRDAEGWRVSMPYIKEFINGVFTFPIGVVDRSQPVTRSLLRRNQAQETTELRRPVRQRHAPAAPSPPANDPSLGRLYRRPPPGAQYYSTQSASPQGYGPPVYSARPVAPSQPYYSQSSGSSQPYYSQSGGSSQSYYPQPGRSNNPFDPYYNRR